VNDNLIPGQNLGLNLNQYIMDVLRRGALHRGPDEKMIRPESMDTRIFDRYIQDLFKTPQQQQPPRMSPPYEAPWNPETFPNTQG